jgi:signal-transduction protein with cAMP-binding, CBS, and nucleotidyltransferase domain
MTLTVSDMMRKKLEIIEELNSVQETATKMKDKNVSSLLVVDADGKPQGLVTERDLARKVCISDVRASTVTNRDNVFSSYYY